MTLSLSNALHHGLGRCPAGPRHLRGCVHSSRSLSLKVAFSRSTFLGGMTLHGMTYLFSSSPRFLCDLLLTGLVFAFGTVPAHAQRTAGDSAGVSGTSPPLVTLNGTVVGTEEYSRRQPMGRSSSGTHLLLQTADGLADLHLGPTTVLSELREAVASGTDVTAKGFHIKTSPSGAYVATRVTVGEKTYHLRDPDTFRPRWSAKQISPPGGAEIRTHWCARWRSHGSRGGRRRGHHRPRHHPHH